MGEGLKFANWLLGQATGIVISDHSRRPSRASSEWESGSRSWWILCKIQNPSDLG